MGRTWLGALTIRSREMLGGSDRRWRFQYVETAKINVVIRSHRLRWLLDSEPGLICLYLRTGKVLGESAVDGII